LTKEIIQENADSLIALGKEAWLKKRRASHKSKMLEEQQEAEVADIEKKKERCGADEQE